MSRHPSRPTPLALGSGLAAAGLAATLLSGCAATPAPASTPTALAITNCGVALDIAAAPERVVTIKSTSTEMLLALGLGDRIVGTAFQDGPVPDAWAADAAGLVSISDKVPERRGRARARARLRLRRLGVELLRRRRRRARRARDVRGHDATSPPPPASRRISRRSSTSTRCSARSRRSGRSSGWTTPPPSLSPSSRRRSAAIEPVPGDHTAFWFSSGSDTPYSGGDIGSPQLVLETAGLTNIVDRRERDLDAAQLGGRHRRRTPT